MSSEVVLNLMIKVSEALVALIRALQAIVFPHQCRACLSIIDVSSVFCSPCLAQIQPIVSVLLPLTKTKTLKVIALASYNGVIRELVLKKFKGDRLASRQLAQLLLQMSPLAAQPVDVVVPVPLHWTRYAWRGFNQAVEMGRVIAGAKKAVLQSCIMRHKKTIFQSRLSAQERQENVRGIFSLHPWYRAVGMDSLRGKHVVIVDDLCTTGATLTQVARMLTPYQPASLTAVVAARTL